MAALIAVATVLSCASKPPEEIVVTPEMEKGLLAGFDRIVLLQNQCADIQSFIDCHTTQAQAAMAALDPFVDPGFLDPSRAGVTANRGALWVCLVARQSGFKKDRTTVERHIIDPRNKLARVIFSIDGYNFGFPMARQDGTWRSPFPGQVVLAMQYEAWIEALRAGVPEAQHGRLDEMLAQASKTLGGFQPNWAMYPELGQKETDELQLMIRERIRKEAEEAEKAANSGSN